MRTQPSCSGQRIGWLAFSLRKRFARLISERIKRNIEIKKGKKLVPSSSEVSTGRDFESQIPIIPKRRRNIALIQCPIMGFPQKSPSPRQLAGRSQIQSPPPSNCAVKSTSFRLKASQAYFFSIFRALTTFPITAISLSHFWCTSLLDKNAMGAPVVFMNASLNSGLAAAFFSTPSSLSMIG